MPASFVYSALLLAWTATFVIVTGIPTLSERPGQGLHKAMTQHHLDLFFGNPNLEDDDYHYHTADPSQVTATGHHITFNLIEAGHLRRRRRSVAPETETDDSSPHTYFKIPAFGKNYQVQVHESKPMYGDYSIIEFYGADGNVTHRQPVSEPTHCYYRGHIPAINGSIVALSTCSGMMGAVYSSEDAFHVHPLPDYLLDHPANTHGHTHLVFRRSVEYGEADEEHESCGVTEREDPASYASSRFNYIPYHSAVDEIYAKFNPQRQAVVKQFGPLHVEMAIVVDPYIYTSFNGNLTVMRSYILTLLNLMQTVMNPEGIGADITLHLTRLIFLAQHQDALPITHDSTALLESFCAFQKRINLPLDSHVVHHDFALLLTGNALCAGDNRKGCGELGRAYIGSLCRSLSSCAVVRNKGIQSAVVMAHELGHVFGAHHDLSVCPIRGGYVMEASTTSTKQFWEFSDCSKAFFREYFSSEKAECALDCPLFFHGLVANNNRLPGQVYSASQQCNYQFPNYTYCSRTPYGRSELCSSLYCDSGDRSLGCWTTYQPALDGTPCGSGRVCYRRKCVNPASIERTERSKLSPCQTLGTKAKLNDRQRAPLQHVIAKGDIIDGGWTTWSKWSPCALTCGNGLASRSRRCINPQPANGGKPCEGSRQEMRTCRLPPCASATAAATNTQATAEEVCAELSTHETGHLLPFTSLNDSRSACMLMCYRASDAEPNPQDFNTALPNGAPCNHMFKGGLISGRCVDGKCVHNIGCDGVQGSGAIKDECGTCGGSGQCCRKVKKVIDPVARSRRGSHLLTQIPQRADNVFLKQQSHSSRFHLSMRIGYSRVLNGRDDIETFVQKPIPPQNKSVLTYTRPSDAPDFITIHGTLQQPINVYSFLMDGTGSNVDPGMELTYTLPQTRMCSADYFWATSKTPCSETCGSGTQVQYSQCVRRSNAAPVNVRNCRGLTGFARNKTMRCTAPVACTTKMYEWRYYRWNECSKSCGSGEQTRTVRCFDVNTRQVVDADNCVADNKPASLQQCNEQLCGDKPARWITKKWSKCSVTCGEGVQVRIVSCRQYVDSVAFNMPPYVCERAGVANRPPQVKRCKNTTCRSNNKPRPCKDISPLCKVVKGGRGCATVGMRSLCCLSCWN